METLSWSSLEDHFRGGGSWLLLTGGTRGVVIGFDSHSESLFVRVPAEPDERAPKLTLDDIVLEKRQDATGALLEISTRAARFFRELHRFAGIVTEEYEKPGQTATGATLAAIRRWRAFLSPTTAMSLEEQLGLYGELVLLQALVRLHSDSAVDSWVGADPAFPGRHDFRWFGFDVEVKCTRSTRRRHVIHGLHQLVPSKNRPLYVLSIRVEPAGPDSGTTLVERITALRHSLAEHPLKLDLFERRLASRYSDADADRYDTPYTIMGECILLPVDESCPRIIPDILTSHMTRETASRVENVNYVVDLEGLGFPVSSSQFQSIFGKLTME